MTVKSNLRYISGCFFSDACVQGQITPSAIIVIMSVIAFLTNIKFGQSMVIMRRLSNNLLWASELELGNLLQVVITVVACMRLAIVLLVNTCRAALVY